MMREEVDEALKLAEEWELKYKVMLSFIMVEKRPNSPFPQELARFLSYIHEFLVFEFITEVEFKTLFIRPSISE